MRTFIAIYALTIAVAVAGFVVLNLIADAVTAIRDCCRRPERSER